MSTLRCSSKASATGQIDEGVGRIQCSRVGLRRAKSRDKALFREFIESFKFILREGLDWSESHLRSSIHVFFSALDTSCLSVLRGP